mgnify:CR=1 FL=1
MPSPLGDDVYREDPTVRALEERVAGLLGKELALFVPSGTMSNQLALLLHTRPGDEVVVGEGALVHELYKIGFTISETDADFVVLGETRHYNFDMIQRAAALIQRGARFVATNPDVAGPAGRPSCGALAAPMWRSY